MTGDQPFIEPSSMEDAMRSMLNTLFTKQLLTEHITHELFINFAMSRPDPEDVCSRLLDRLRDVVDRQFSAPHLAECHSVGLQYIDMLKENFASAKRAW